ncbi:MAG: hypothetical protein HUU50_19225 [Candidatus Brocadiae bacterium]|nr:hypothetical protein [Candidatus Brocadiia bacterium]
MRTKANLSLFLLLRKLRIFILVLSAGIFFYLPCRFGILQDFQGAYLLVDWQYSLGRKLCVGDRVVYQPKNIVKYKTGRIFLLPEPKESNIYWINSEEGLLHATEKIKARVLMVLFQANPENFTSPY